MRIFENRDWLQVAGLVGVIAGLVLVAYEMRQANKFAEAETIRAMYQGWDSVQVPGIESDFFDVYVKSFEDPDGLTAAEIMRMDAWLTAHMNQYDSRVYMNKMGLNPFTTVFSNDAQFEIYFGSAFSRAWFSQNKDWLDPELREAISERIDSRPAQSSPSYVAIIRSELSSQQE